MPSPGSDTHRLFFALWPDDRVRAAMQAAAAEIRNEHGAGGRPTGAARYHLTLQFLGDFSPWPSARVDAACEAAAGVSAAAFDLQLDHAGSFGGSRVWWLGCSEPPAALLALWAALGASLEAARVPVRAHETFTPHVTVHRGARQRLPSIPIQPIDWPVRGFVLIDSQPQTGYRELGRWPLR